LLTEHVTVWRIFYERGDGRSSSQAQLKPTQRMFALWPRSLATLTGDIYYVTQLQYDKWCWYQSSYWAMIRAVHSSSPKTCWSLGTSPSTSVLRRWSWHLRRPLRPRRTVRRPTTLILRHRTAIPADPRGE